MSVNKYEKDQSYYLVSNKWYLKYVTALKNQKEFKVPINNEFLLYNGHVKPNLIKDKDYIVITGQKWEELFLQYGGGPVVMVSTYVNANGDVLLNISQKSVRIKFEGIEFLLFFNRDSKIKDVKAKASQILGYDSSSIIMKGYLNGEIDIIDENDIICDNERVNYSTYLLKRKPSIVFTDRHHTRKVYSSGICGLVNSRNGCYANSVIQCLSHCPLFVKEVLNKRYKNSTSPVLSNTYNLINQIWGTAFENTPNPLSLRNSFSNRSFVSGTQEDAHQFFLTLINELLFSDPNIKYPDNIDDSFTSILSSQNDAFKLFKLLAHRSSSQTHCSVCSHSQMNYSYGYCISLNLPSSQSKSIPVQFIPYDRSKRPIVLHYMLDDISMAENIDEIYQEVGYSFSYIRYLCCTSENDPISNTILQIFEILDPSKMYALINLKANIQYQDKITEIPVSTSFVVPFDTTNIINDFYWIIDQRIHPLWKDYDEIEESYNFEQHLFFQNDIEYGDNKVIFGSLKFLEFDGKLKDDKLFAFVNATLNPKFLSAKDGFDWRYAITTGVFFSNNSKDSEIVLENCFQNTFRKISLDKANEWFCPKCKKLVPTTLTYRLERRPEILVLHLNRFKNSGNNYIKNNSTIRFQKEFQLDNSICSEPGRYKLVGLIEHAGNINSGHYFSYAFHQASNKWYLFNDTEFDEVEQETVLKSNPYMLFYQIIS